MKTDTKCLALAYLGCLLMTLASLIYPHNVSSNPGIKVIGMGCVILFGAIIIKDANIWEDAINKVCRNIKCKI